MSKLTDNTSHVSAKRWIMCPLCGLFMTMMSVVSFAGENESLFGGDDTILVEKTVKPSLSLYSTLHVLEAKYPTMAKFTSVLRSRNKNQDAVAHNFADYAERWNYKVDMASKSIKLKFELSL